MKNEQFIGARNEKKWTQEELARRIGCGKTTISNWENGYSSPDLEDAFRVADVLGKTVDELFRSVKVQETHTNSA